jgi:phosphoglycerol transferase
MAKILKNFAVYLIAPILSLLLFCLGFEIWKIDFSKPFFLYEHDALFTLFIVKTIIQNGWFFSNELVGFPHLGGYFYLHDFPSNADFFNFLLIKFFAFFSSNLFIIVNCFFLLTFALISFSSFAVLRSFGISIFTAVIISVLYSFLPYHFYRGIWHLFLANYVVIPLSFMVALWISAEKIKLIGINKKEQYCLAPNRYFFIALLISCFAATNGIYYAIYSGIIFIFAWFLTCLKKGVFFDRETAVPFTLFLAIILTLLLLYIPCFKYWIEHGINSSVASRDIIQSEAFALKIINIFLPIENHYLTYLSDVRKIFKNSIPEYEGSYASLGFLGSMGFLFLLLWLFVKNHDGEKSFLQKTIKKFSLNENEQNLISNLAGLNLVIVLFACVGGIVMFIIPTFPMLRSHARFSIFIAFFSLFLIAIIFEKLLQKRKNVAQIFILLIAVLAFFDQVGKDLTVKIQPPKLVKNFENDRDFVQEIEQKFPDAVIFQMPLTGFPETDNYDLMKGYLHSKNLRWSYPAMRGREADLWQQKVAKMNFKNFISELKKAGFKGIYIDRFLTVDFSKEEKEKPAAWQALRKFESDLKNITKSPHITSKNLQLVFYEI